MPDPEVVRPPEVLTPDRLREVLDVLEEGVAILGPDGVVEYVNPSGERILRLAPGEVLGCRLMDFRWEIVDLEGRPLSKEWLPTLRATRTGEPVGPIVVGMTSNAVPELEWVEVSARPLRGAGGKPPHATVTSFRQITDRVRAVQALRESEERYQALAQSVPVGVFHADPGGAAVWVNRAMADITGLSYEESLGMGWTRALHPDDRDQVSAAWVQAAETHTPFKREHRYLLPDGSVRWVVCQASEMTDERGRSLGWVGSVTDVTEAKRAALLKDQIIGHVSHELRAPLISIRGGLSFLEPHLKDAGDAPRRFLAMAVRNTELLDRLVRDLLDIERLQSGQAGLEMEPVVISEVLSEARDVVFPQATGLGVAVREPQAVPVTVSASRDRLLQVFTNLLSNAAKYSEPGGEVWTDVRTEPGYVTVGVHDRGRGIAPEDHQRVFEPFVQVRRSETGEPAGAGLGLAIARAIVLCHGGRIWVESALGSGASFFVSLPAS